MIWARVGQGAPEPPQSTQIGHRLACQVILEPVIQHSCAPTALRP
jgi:hypothetical protein